MGLFERQNQETDQKQYDEEKAKRGGIDWAERNWKPSPGDDGNLIRILAGVSGFGWHLKGAKHFIQHADCCEAFTCNKEVYGKPCPACRENEKLFAAGKKEAAKAYRRKSLGMFNIIDRGEKDAHVRLYEAPHTVWEAIVHISLPVRGWHFQDEFDDKAYEKDGTIKILKDGRDMLLFYKPKEAGSNMYKVTAVPNASPLATSAEQILTWQSQVIALDLGKLYPEADYDVAEIKTFGSPQEREDLKEAMKQIREEERATKDQADQADEVAEAPEEKITPEVKTEPKEEEPRDTEREPTIGELEAILEKKKKAAAEAEATEDIEEAKEKAAKIKADKKAKAEEKAKAKAEAEATPSTPQPEVAVETPAEAEEDPKKPEVKDKMKQKIEEIRKRALEGKKKANG